MAKKGWIYAVLMVLSASLLVDEASAIPAFARKYRFSCSTCHVSVPKLKDYGEEFAANGFMLPKDQEPTRAYVRTGDDELLLQRQLPIAIRFDIWAQLADRETAKSDFQFPYGIKLLSGGPISRHVSYYFYFYIDERGEVAGIEDAYVHFNNLGGSNFDIMAGQFQVSDPLFKRELRLTLEDYLIYKVRGRWATANLTYDRGVILTYGFGFGLDLFAEIINGNGIGKAENRLFDNDNYKNVAFRASQSLGALRVGGFLYRGKEKIENGTTTIRMLGPDFTLSLPKLEINGQYLYRKDTAIMVGGVDGENTIKGGFVEAIFMPNGDRSRWFLTGLYNWIDSDYDPLDYQTLTLSLSHLAARNMRLVIEWTRDLQHKRSRLSLGMVSAF
ncbi:MAG: hypothetical protein Q9P14_06555 [candidate division KSB1 bacterium]|nr:hypothetical protein [candidate division KSB1 bacterium]MDQ7063089.1 hypothetical protein [candidate division KSB1 bacterium]